MNWTMAMMQLDNLHTMRASTLHKLGPRPAWWRPIARARWDRARAKIGRLFVDRAVQLSSKYAPGITREALEVTWG